MQSFYDHDNLAKYWEISEANPETRDPTESIMSVIFTTQQMSVTIMLYFIS